jgi:prepilin-type N-terminal cleavage/methylation domain-containing protein
MRRRHSHSRAFSLLELVVVIVVIGVVAAMAIPRMSRAAATARESACIATIRVYANGIEQFEAIHGRYPAGITPSVIGLNYLPASPFGGSPTAPVLNDPGGDASQAHPADKRFRADSPAAKTFWYNRANGLFRALVPQTPDSDFDAWLYNRLNGSRVGGGAMGTAPAAAPTGIDAGEVEESLESATVPLGLE